MSARSDPTPDATGAGHPNDRPPDSTTAAAPDDPIGRLRGVWTARAEDIAKRAAADPEEAVALLTAPDAISLFSSLSGRHGDKAAWMRIKTAIRAVRGVSLSDLEAAIAQHRKRADDASSEAAREVAELAPAAADRRNGSYFARRGALFHEKTAREDRIVETQITTFDARIVEEVVHDDGAEQRTLFRIEGVAEGRPLSPIDLPAERFDAMNWPTSSWGCGAAVLPGQRDHARYAIQILSGSPSRRTCYGHLGWRRIGGEYLFLHAAGAIGVGGVVSGVDVRADGPLGDFVLPDPPVGRALREAVEASLSILDLAPRPLTWPVLASVYRAPLSEVLPADFTVFLAGPTGSQKSEMTGQAQAHYGAGFSSRNLPAAWSATANALEKLAFLAKDALTTVDDFAPSGVAADVARIHREAERLLRGAGNRRGRARMRADGSLRPDYFPRGLIVSSGEDVPKGQSIRARTLVLEVEPGSVRLDRLTAIQGSAADGALARSMAGYVRWLAGRLEGMRAVLPGRRTALRERARGAVVGHDRTPDIVANLFLGVEAFLDYALEAGAVDRRRADELRREAWAALVEVAGRQRDIHEAEDPLRRFIEMLRAAIASGSAHVANQHGEAPQAAERMRWGWRQDGADWRGRGTRIGWVDGEDLYLEPNAAYEVVQASAGRQGMSIGVQPRTLWKRLAEVGWLASRDAARQRFTVRRILQGARQDVVHLRVGTLSLENRPNRPIRPTAPGDGGMPLPEASNPWDGRESSWDGTVPSADATVPQPDDLEPRDSAALASVGDSWDGWDGRGERRGGPPASVGACACVGCRSGGACVREGRP